MWFKGMRYNDRQDDVRILQRFWKAEIRGRKLTIEAVHRGGMGGGTTTKTYRTREAAEHAAQIELGKKLRLGYQPIPGEELAALQRFTTKASGERPYRPKKAAPSQKVYAARLQRFWRAKRDIETVVTTSGDIAGRTQSKTKTYRDIGMARWKAHLADNEIAKDDYYQGSVKELTALHRYLTRLNARLAKAPVVRAADLPTGAPPPAATVVPRRAPAPGRGTVKRAGPYADAFTSPVVHFVRMSPTKPSPLETAARGTSGGRPIMAEGQAWPTCSQCREPLSLYLQLDVEPAMQLGFMPGSHLLVFNCAACDGMALTVPNKNLPKSWLSADNPQTYRVILNRPATREAVYPPDATMLEQKVRLTRGAEKLSRLIEDDDRSDDEPPRGRDGFKIGGIPHRIQPWMPPRCNCGATLGFVVQVTSTVDPGWRSKQKKAVGFLGQDVFIHACTKQCSPYATIVIPDR
jgi:predicted DNA-binding WGR domain protein